MSRFSQRDQAKEDKLQTENTRILHKLQFSLSNASLSGLSTSAKLLPLHQVLICGTYVLPQLRQIWNNIQSKLNDKDLYKISISGMRIKLLELQKSDEKTPKIMSKRLKNDYEEVDWVFYHQKLLFVLEVIRTELISQHYDNPLAWYFGINKTKNLVSQKYYWLKLQKDIKAYVKSCDICLGLKTVRYKLYGDLQSLSLPTHW